MNADQQQCRLVTLPSWPFYIAAALLLITAVSIWHIAYVWDRPYFPSWQLITTVSLMFLAAALLFVWPHILYARLQVLADLPESIKRLEFLLSDADTVLRSYGKARTAIEALRESVDSEKKSFEDMWQEVFQSLMDFQQKDLEVQELRRDRERACLEIDAWQRTAVEYLDHLQQILGALEADDPRRATVERTASAFTKYSAPRSLERICPTAGEPFIEDDHQAHEEEDSSEVPAGCIVRCDEWGYRAGEEVVKRAKVVISKSTIQLN